MKITTERAEELADALEKYTGRKGDVSIARALVKERDEQANEIALLKTTIRNLESRDIHSCGHDCQRSGCVNRRLREQLAAAQAVIAKKDEALEIYSAEYNAVWTNGMPILEPILDSALAIPSDDTALREILAGQWEKAAEKVRSLSLEAFPNDKSYADALSDELRAEADKIAKGGHCD